MNQLTMFNNPADGDELFIGLVGAVGTEFAKVTDPLESALKQKGYQAKYIRLSELLRSVPKWSSLKTTPEEERYNSHMTAGDEFRTEMARGDALAVYAFAAIKDVRESLTNDQNTPAGRIAYILRSLKHPDEVNTLRKVYQENFILIAAYSSREERVTQLATRIAKTHQEIQVDQFRANAETLILRDEAEVGNKWGQNVRDVFPKADIFVDVDNIPQAQVAVGRFVELLFGNTFHTPSKDEYGMFLAHAAALRSASLGRQVGVSILNEQGDLLALGTNDVPKAGGGLYWPGDQPDYRDHVLGHDSSDEFRRTLLADILKRFLESGWFTESISNKPLEELVDEATRGGDIPMMRGAHFMNLIEYGRAVHAEMSALLSAARLGIPIKDSVLYTTTYPCHDCAKHIVSAGIKRIVYIEPYPKSLAPRLFRDSISSEQFRGSASLLNLQPFVGIAPRKYLELFTMIERKDNNGKILDLNSLNTPRSVLSTSVYLVEESATFQTFRQELREKKLQ